MFISKKIAKARLRPAALLEKTVQQNLSPKPDKKKSRRCRFQEIPPPTKYVQNSVIYPIYGDLPFIEHNERLSTDISLFNLSKVVQEITIGELYQQKIVILKLTQRVDQELPTWGDFVNHLNISEQAELRDWGTMVKQFCHTYSKVMQRQSRKKMKSEPRKKFFAEVTFKTEQQKHIIFNLYPCLHLKFRLKNHHNQLKEIIYSEKFIKELGYTTESFVSTAFNEGIPQLMPFDNPLAKHLLKPLIENYFTLAENGNEIPELDSMLLFKDNFVRNTTFKIFCFMNYESNTFGMDIILAVTAIGEPISYPHNVSGQKFDTEFVKSMVSKEEETEYFLSQYYGESVQRKYTDVEKTCLIRELEVAENIIVKFPEENN